MHPSWMVQAISMAIYVQTIGAFVWLFLVVLLERGRRSDRARLARLEGLVDLQGRSAAGHSREFAEYQKGTTQALEDCCRAIEAVRETFKLREENASMRAELRRRGESLPADEHEQTDPAFRLPSGIDNPRPESVEVDDEPLGSVAAGHWQCVGCRRTYALCEGHHGKKCFGCGATLELVAYDKPRQNVQLPLPIKASGDK